MFQEFHVDLSNFQIIELIGEGSFGKVYLIQHKQSHKRFAAKVSRYESEVLKSQKSFLHELKAYSKVKHQAVLSFYGFNMTNFENEPYPTIILNYMQNGSLDKAIKNSPPLSSANKYIILYGIAEGMKYLHSRGIIHRDLKPGNILLDQNLYPHICDFGESKISDLSITLILTQSYSGTPLYMAPEILSEEPYNYKVDIFSYSILAYELLTGRRAFQGFKTRFKLHKAVLRGKRPDTTFIENEDIKDLLNEWWSHDPNQRPSFDTIIRELKKDNIKKAFNVLNNAEVEKYIQLFDKALPPLRSLSKRSDEREGTMDLSEEKRKIAEYHKREADKGNLDSIIAYAIMLFSGDGIQINISESSHYFKMAADKGYVPAMVLYGMMIDEGLGGYVNKEEAVIYYKKAADKGEENAMYNYARMLNKGDGIPANKKEAVKYYKILIKKGNDNAMFDYALMIDEGDGIEKDKKEAAKYYKKLGEKGCKEGMFNYALMLDNGDGIEQNKKEAFRLYKKLADEGYVSAMFKCGIFFFNGYGVQKDIKQAALYFKMAADNHHVDSMYIFGQILNDGFGIKSDKKESARYFKMAADNGNKEAMVKYAELLERGEVIPQNKKEAEQYRRMLNE